jgi:hypothetical protein
VLWSEGSIVFWLFAGGSIFVFIEDAGWKENLLLIKIDGLMLWGSADSESTKHLN